MVSAPFTTGEKGPVRGPSNFRRAPDRFRESALHHPCEILVQEASDLNFAHFARGGPGDRIASSAVPVGPGSLEAPRPAWAPSLRLT